MNALGKDSKWFWLILLSISFLVSILLGGILFLVYMAGMAVVVWLQIFLSKKDNKWLGLILPAISFLFSILAVLNIAAFTHSSTTVQTIDEAGKVVNQVVGSASTPLMDTPSLIGTILSVFLIYNISTAVLLAIYGACKSKLKRKIQLEKMSVQDLE